MTRRGYEQIREFKREQIVTFGGQAVTSFFEHYERGERYMGNFINQLVATETLLASRRTNELLANQFSQSASASSKLHAMREYLEARMRWGRDTGQLNNPTEQSRWEGMADMIAIMAGTSPADEYNYIAWKAGIR